MIQEICNIGNEHLIDTFHKVAIFESSQLAKFNHLTPEATIQSIFETVPDDYQVLLTDLLPNNIQVSHSTTIKDDGKAYNTRISFILTPQDKSLQDLLETYNNQEVVILISKRNTTHLYGTSAQPLLFRYSELNSNNPSQIKGYTVILEGQSYGPTKHFEDVTFTIYSRGLAFQLAQEI